MAWASSGFCRQDHALRRRGQAGRLTGTTTASSLRFIESMGEAMKVGFIGVGNMGGPMCRNIIRNTNHEVVVFDISPDAVKACTDIGASSGSSVADVAACCDVVITSLPIPRIVEEVTLGAGGISENARPNTEFIDLST